MLVLCLANSLGWLLGRERGRLHGKLPLPSPSSHIHSLPLAEHSKVGVLGGGEPLPSGARGCISLESRSYDKLETCRFLSALPAASRDWYQLPLLLPLGDLSPPLQLPAWQRWRHWMRPQSCMVLTLRYNKKTRTLLFCTLPSMRALPV